MSLFRRPSQAVGCFEAILYSVGSAICEADLFFFFFFLWGGRFAVYEVRRTQDASQSSTSIATESEIITAWMRGSDCPADDSVEAAVSVEDVRLAEELVEAPDTL